MSIWIGLALALLAILRAVQPDDYEIRRQFALRDPEKAAAYKHVRELFTLKDYNK